jgi:DNA-binding CsgD family transcriptional regulator
MPSRHVNNQPILSSSRINITLLIFLSVLTMIHFAQAIIGASRISQLVDNHLLVLEAVMLSYLVLNFFLAESMQAYMQVLLLYATVTVVLLYNGSLIIANGISIVATFLAFKYGFLNRYRLPKLAVITLIMWAHFGIPAIQDPALITESVKTAVVFMLFITVMYASEISYNRAFRMISDEATQAVQKFGGNEIDLVEKGFTPRQLDVAYYLVHTKKTDRELAQLIDIKIDTLRNHFKAMRAKLDVSSKIELIEACRWYVFTHMHPAAKQDIDASPADD